ETALLYVHELKRLLEDAMPNLDADCQDRILFQQLLAGLPDDCSRALRAIPEIKITAYAVSRARLLMTVSHQASVPTVASVNAGKIHRQQLSTPFKAMLGTSRNRCHR
ncbi:hypothetical protein EMCRGX_G009264, partial [Ephydatia muelleri]